MKQISKITLLAAASSLALAPMAGLAWADSNAAAKAADNATQAQAKKSPEMLRASIDAMAAFASVHQARLALYDGQTDAAKKLVQSARDAFTGDMAKYLIKVAPKTAKTDTKTADKTTAADSSTTQAANAQPSELAVPLDTSFDVAENFVFTDAHKKPVKDAQEAMKKGDKAGAAAALINGEVDIDISAMVVPVKQTITDLQAVLSDINAGKFYDANLKLKTVEKLVQVVSYTPDTLPKQGYPAKGVF
ncbi:YfdX family protein [Aquicoccus sp. G2-2]|uniref:YfdX family protein n=1 Tax=Aquicoccus sp. G2-2 TaxID=3092120 RepID=UPI002AE0012E|nr:YfdX family protein [Aquicoccus sp. G2-2]MEA1114859.1 YfdX family protein [Aquicoccus sp. G2-2]